MDRKLASAGRKTRGEVLGESYVKRSLQTMDDFNREFVENILHEYAWGFVWTRKGLPRGTRSMLNLAMLSVLGRSQELKLHIRGALRNGVSKSEIKEVFLQVAIYAGVPAAVESFRAARQVFAEAEAEAGSSKPTAKALAVRAAKKTAKKPAAKKAAKKPAAKKAAKKPAAKKAAKKPAAKKAAKKPAARKAARKPAAKKAAALAVRAAKKAAKKPAAKKAAAKKPAAKKAAKKPAAKK